MEDEHTVGPCHCLVSPQRSILFAPDCDVVGAQPMFALHLCTLTFTCGVPSRRISPALRPQRRPVRSGRRRKPTFCQTRACCSGRARMPVAPRRSSIGQSLPAGSLRLLRQPPQQRVACRQRLALRRGYPWLPLRLAALGQRRAWVAATVLQATHLGRCLAWYYLPNLAVASCQASQ